MYRFFKDGDAKNTLSVPVGNVTETTNLTYEFSNAESKCNTLLDLLKGVQYNTNQILSNAAVKIKSITIREIMTV